MCYVCKGKEPKHAKKAQECDDTHMLAFCCGFAISEELLKM
jgi:hypothetical protein